MRKLKSITEQTKHAILDAAWRLIAQRGRADIGMAEIASLAGVSRQTIFYAFGGRSGLLLAMVRHKDQQTDHVARLRAIVANPCPDREALICFTDIWLDYLPVIYPVGILLDSAALTDEDAASAWTDRMIHALLKGFVTLTSAIHEHEPFSEPPARIAEAIWAEVHPSMWRRLVVDCGWTPDAFRKRQSAVVNWILERGSP